MKRALTREEMRDVEINIMSSYLKVITKGTDFRYKGNKKTYYYWYNVEKPCPTYTLMLSELINKFGRNIETVIDDNKHNELSMYIYFRGYAHELG